jgi:hypothetical protein
VLIRHLINKACADGVPETDFPPFIDGELLVQVAVGAANYSPYYDLKGGKTCGSQSE